RSVAGIGHHMVVREAIPDEQDHDRPDRRADQAGALIDAIPPDGLPDEGGDERAGDPEHGGQDEAGRVVRSAHEKPRDDAGNEANHHDPDEIEHGYLPRLTCARSGRGRTASPAALTDASR